MRYVPLAHNTRHPESGNSFAQVLHSCGRKDQLDRDMLGRLVGSLSRYLMSVNAPQLPRTDPVDSELSFLVSNSRAIPVPPPRPTTS